MPMDKSDKPYLLVSDLDDTLLGNSSALRRFRDYYVSECADLVDVVYSSGRFADSIRNDLSESDLPKPSYIIGGVGSEIRSYPDNQVMEDWEAAMSTDWSADRVVHTLEDDDTMKLQPQSSQSAFKVSYCYPNATQDHLEKVRRRLSEAGLKTNIIYSSQEDLDILPAGVDKGTAAEFVARHLGYANEQVITAGNSGNDATLLKHGFHGIVVANAHHQLRDLVRKYHAYQSPNDHAAGVEDGLRHWLKRLQNSND